MAWPSPENAMVAWAKATSSINSKVAGRISTRLPEKPTMPYLTVFQVGGAPASGETPINVALMQFDAYGARFGSDGITISPDYQAADDVGLAVIEEAHQSGNVQFAGFIYGMDVLAYRRLPEEDTNWAHYAADVLLIIREDI